MADADDANKALLVGEIAGLLSTRLPVEIEVGDDGDYTGRILIMRPSGRWCVTVELTDPSDDEAD